MVLKLWQFIAQMKLVPRAFHFKSIKNGEIYMTAFDFDDICLLVYDHDLCFPPNCTSIRPSGSEIEVIKFLPDLYT